MRSKPTVKYLNRAFALLYLTVLLVVPLGLIMYRTFEPGFGSFIDSMTTPAAQSAINLSLLIVAIVVPLNVVFGVIIAIALARGRWRGKAVVEAIVDLPFAISPVIVGVSLILVWGVDGWFGFLSDWGFKVIFAVPGMVLATIFVTLPFVVREVEPVLQEIGVEQEEAAATLGAGTWQTFRRITLPAIRWGLSYGIILTIARSLGEFGAVIMVSGNQPGVSQTLTLLVYGRHQEGKEYGAYAASTTLMALALIALVVMNVLNRRRANTGVAA
ncbi:sulfate ABC transporter permease subunit CysW [Williamsia sp. CHRR-6]|uniref:sulfate ABC transporter permease subunit CysW n=1 Tax=Williamsia sp. CHRR-6 TaxID=2835871 RepID=UPI001BDA4B46|nr:sulfate ABC transporter permease subunit CysW [Williamsia sp. CHRR-6]MBT0567838.1 sulfate ABC transporter permease subunit CysW [Williamsia sp. CHRR-6]